MSSFNCSEKCTIGIELEIQLVNKTGFNLIGLAGDLIKQLDVNIYTKNIKPEITQGMLEINSNVQNKPEKLLEELKEIRDYLINQATALNICFTGGGTHPFQLWNERKIYPIPRFKRAAHTYGYLAKMFTVFGLHIHIGCPSGDEAIYLTHALATYVPQFIALSASSPFCQTVDTEFHSSRSNVVHSFPLSGLAPISSSWEEFSLYIEKMRELKIVENVDNFYWDIRPRPEFGTIEIRVCDSPLTLERVAMLAAYAQTIAHYLLTEKPKMFLFNNQHQIYKYNNFQAGRYAFEGININPSTYNTQTISDAILETCAQIENHSIILNNDRFLSKVVDMATHQYNDAQWLRTLHQAGSTLPEIVYQKSLLWADRLNIQ